MVLAVVVVGAWFAYTQRNNLKAVYLAMTSDADTLKQKEEEQDKKREELLQQYGLTEPDVSQIEGENTTAPQTEPPASSSPQTSPSTGGTETTQTPSGQSGQDSQTQAMKAKLQSYVNQLYQVEAKYQGYLNGVVAAAKQEFAALPKEQKNSDNKMRIVRGKMGELIAQENACDAEVETILSGMQATLKQYGQSNDLVNQIRSYYEESKATWKAEKMVELYG